MYETSLESHTSTMKAGHVLVELGAALEGFGLHSRGSVRIAGGTVGLFFSKEEMKGLAILYIEEEVANSPMLMVLAAEQLSHLLQVLPRDSGDDRRPYAGCMVVPYQQDSISQPFRDWAASKGIFVFSLTDASHRENVAGYLREVWDHVENAEQRPLEDTVGNSS